MSTGLPLGRWSNAITSEGPTISTGNSRPERKTGLSRISDVGLTVAKGLELPPLDQGQVLAGHRGLERPITWVHVVDHRDMSDSIHGQELLLTSGIALANDEAFQSEIFEIMAAQGSAGLIVSQGGYIDQMPPRMLEAAEATGIPLIGIPWDVNFGDITRTLLTHLVQTHYTVLEKAQRLNRDLLEIVLRKGDLTAVCSRLEQSIGSVVAVYNEALGLIAVSSDRKTGLADLRAPLADSVRKREPGDTAMRPLMKGDQELGFAVPIGVGHRTRGWLVVHASEDPGGERGQQDLIRVLTAEISATIASLIILHEDEIEQVEKRHDEAQLLGLLDGRIGPHSNEAADVGLRPNEPVEVVVIEIGEGATQDALLLVRNLLRRFFDFQAFAVRGRALVGLVQRLRISRTANWAGRVAEALDTGGYRPRIAVSGEITNHAQIPSSFQITHNSVKLGQVLWPSELVQRTENMAVLGRAMRNLMDGTSLEEVCPAILKLEEHDRSLHGSLVEALECILEVDGNASLAARKLGIHRHTMLYRLNRISEILGVELNSVARLELRLQLIAWRLAGHRGELSKDG